MSIATLTPRVQLPIGDVELARRFARSARVTDSRITPNDQFDDWFAEQRRVNRFEVTPIPLDRLRGWHFRPETGDLVHDTGRFFSIEGISVRTDFERERQWTQPIINQPEIGILGILAKEFDGVLHFLMQAKMEPGNINTVQLSPTVQATRSNYIGVHGGRPITFIEYFADRSRGTAIVDVLQSEQGAWFLRKRNRNMLVEVRGDVPEHPGFRWLTLGQINRLMRVDNIVNMDARTVLSCVPQLPGAEYGEPEYQAALRHSLDPASWTMHADGDILHWLTEIKSRHEVVQRVIGMHWVREWHRGEYDIAHDTGKYFRVMAAEVTASNREVPAWTQPLLEPVGQGIAAFLTRRINGVLHLLMHAKTEAGSLDVVELTPTVQAQPANYADLPPEQRPRFIGEACYPDPATVRYDTVQSEEGGRFYYAENRYRIVDVGDDFPIDVPSEYCWMTPRQVMSLLKHSYYVNIQARSLFAGLLSIA
jgi:oxidase EvaA